MLINFKFQISNSKFFIFCALCSVFCLLFFSGTAYASLNEATPTVIPAKAGIQTVSQTNFASTGNFQGTSDINQSAGDTQMTNINTLLDSNSVDESGKDSKIDRGNNKKASTNNIANSSETTNNTNDPASDKLADKFPETKLTQADTSQEEDSTGSETTAQTSSASTSSGGGSVNDDVISDWTVKPIQITQASNTGAATTGIPIIIPPGRIGLEPNISLNYSSNRKNGWIGVGWSLDVGSIQRSTKRGIDYNANDYLVAVNGSTSELVPRGDWGTNYYGAKIEGEFSKYYYDSVAKSWKIIAKNGTKYYFGSTLGSRQDDPDDANRIFKWCLDRVEDTNGNYMEIFYLKDQGEIYLNEIKYTGNTAGLLPANSVKFILETTERTDTYEGYTTHFPVKTAYRLETIEVYGNGKITRTYELQYQYSSDTGRSLLTNITQYGSVGNELLSSTLGYSSINSNFSYTTWSQNGFGISPYGALRVGDFNGDGKNDVSFSFSFDYDTCTNDCQQNCESDCMYSCEQSCEDSCDDSYDNCVYDCGYSCEDYCEDECSEDNVCDTACQGADDYDLCFEVCLEDPYQLIDDCKNICEDDCNNTCTDNCWDALQSCESSCDNICSDICVPTCEDSCDQACMDSCGNYCGNYGIDDNTWVGISNNTGFNYSMWDQNIFDRNTDDPYGAGDFNGDGKSDVVFYEYRDAWVGISNGSGFNYGVWSQNGVGINPYKTFGVGDFNGDGLSDVVFYYEDGNTWVGISNGSGFTFSTWSQNSFGTNPYEAFRVGDFNGDGMSDVVFYYEDGNTWVGISNGSGFTYNIWSQNGFGTEPYETFGVGDFNGDGLSDVVFYYEDGNTWVGISNGSGFTFSTWSQNSFGTQPYEAFRVGDFNGNGLSDVMRTVIHGLVPSTPQMCLIC